MHQHGAGGEGNLPNGLTEQYNNYFNEKSFSSKRKGPARTASSFLTDIFLVGFADDSSEKESLTQLSE